MANLLVRPSVDKYIEASDEMLSLFEQFLTIWKEGGRDIDVIEARRIYMFMIKEDHKRDRPHIGDGMAFNRHSWVVGEYASLLARKISEKHPGAILYDPDRMLYAGGSHDIGKLLLADDYQHAHEHLAWILETDNDCAGLAKLTQPHQPGEERVLKMLHDAGDFIDIDERAFCMNRSFAADLIMLADSSCGTGYDGIGKRYAAIRASPRYPPEHPLIIGMADPQRGENRVIEIEKRVNKLLS